MTSPTRFPMLRDPDWLRERYYDQGQTMAEIAHDIGCTPATVLYALRREGLATRTSGEQMARRGTARSRRPFRELWDVDWLQSHYGQTDATIKQTAERIGCSRAGVAKALRRFNIPIREEINRIFRQQAVAQLADVEWLRAQRKAGRTKEDIANELGCSPDAVQKAFWRHGIRVREWRPQGEAVKTSEPLTYRKGGYILVWAPEHPAASTKGLVPQHRLVAEAGLGRPLLSREVVHHLNFQRDDNRPENLMVFSTNGAHISFEANPPAWVPRCSCCGKPHPESLTGRPTHVPMLYDLA